MRLGTMSIVTTTALRLGISRRSSFLPSLFIESRYWNSVRRNVSLFIAKSYKKEMKKRGVSTGAKKSAPNPKKPPKIDIERLKRGIEIDGCYPKSVRNGTKLRFLGGFKEGGGQILRNASALAAITGQQIYVDNIRASKKRTSLSIRKHV